MPKSSERGPSPHVLVIADVESNAVALVERILKPAGIRARTHATDGPSPDMLLVDVTQLRGDPLASLRDARTEGEEAPAIVLAAHFPHARLRDMFRLGVNDFLLKPYRPESLIQAIRELAETRSTEVNTQILARRLETARELERRRSEEIRMLTEIGRVVVDLGDLDSILGRVVEAAAFLTDAEEASIYIADPATNELVLRASKQAGDRHATLQRLRVEDTLVGEVFATGQPILRQATADSGPIKVQTGFLAHSLVKVPLRMKDRIVGVLGIYNRIATRTFSEHHRDLLLALAHWAGVALEHAFLKQQSLPLPTQIGRMTVVSPGMIEGLDRARRSVETLLSGDFSKLSPLQLDKIQSIRDQIVDLCALPVATLGADEVQEMVDIPGLLFSVSEGMAQLAERRGLDLVVESGPPMPRFRGDAARARRVIHTLVEASLRRTTEGRVVLEAERLEVHGGTIGGAELSEHVDLRDGLWALVRISDTSPGLPAETVRAITAPKIDPQAGKLGPGLSLGEVRMIVESMMGAVWYEQTPGNTAIVIALPIT